ncbi:MAG: ATP-binding protein [Chloroflexota bacterium]
MESVPPCSLIDYTALVYAAQAESGQITLQTDCDPDCPTVGLADTDRMMQVLGNLVSNALRHTPAGGQVTLAAECLDGQVQLAVRDTGSGIAAEDLPYVFDRFYRADKARQADGATGLGLAIARSLVESAWEAISP